MGLFKTVTEGGQILAHRLRMARQVLKIVCVISFLASLSFFCYRIIGIQKIHYQSFGYYLKARASTPFQETTQVDGKFWSKVSGFHLSKESTSQRNETVIKACTPFVSSLKKQLSHELDRSILVGSYTFGISLLFFLIRGWRSRQKTHIDGKQVVSSFSMACKLKLLRRASFLKFGSLPLVKGTETQHILISGATGSGKTNAYHHLLPQIRKKRQRAVIVDITGEYVEKYYRAEKDILLNPLDKRAASWHPWCECAHSVDYKTIAQSLIPSSYREEENFWRKGAQEVFFAALKECSDLKSNSHLAKLMLYDPLSTLSTLLTGTTATAYLDMSAEKTAGSIRAVASSFLECLDLLPDTKSPFSIRDWVAKENDGSWLFLTCTVRQRASLLPLVSAWLSIAVSSVLQLPQDIHRRLWVVIDELPKMNRLKDLESFLTEGRKFGGCGLLAIQSPAQLESLYGRDVTSTILGNCATRIAFAEYDPEIAHRISKSFGEKETRESQEGISYGAHEMRDGVNLSFQNRTSPVVSPSSLQSLNIRESFIKLPGNLPVTKIKLSYQKRPKISEAFTSKKETCSQTGPTNSFYTLRE